jgi:mannose-6-phosphate isomerase-like protein (cupin superfamily)
MIHRVGDRSDPYLLPAGATRVEGAMLPFKVVAGDSDGLISVCEFTLPGWASGPVLHAHDAVDEGFFVVSGALEMQLGDERRAAAAGDFAWVPRGTAHTFANASPEPLHVIGFATPGGIEHQFAEQWEYLTSVDEPDPQVLDEIGTRHGAPTLGPPIRATNVPPGLD